MQAITTIRRADIFDHLCEAVDAARVSAADNAAWLARIDEAWGWLLEQEAYDVADLRDHAAVCIPSASQSGVVYQANGACQCAAYRHSNPCWHRAASKLACATLCKQKLMMTR